MFHVVNKFWYDIPKTYCFDDLGTENNLRHYGNNCNVMAEILLSRYDQFTTNLNSTEIEEMYGERIRSRMREHLSERERIKSLKGIFKRDIEDNPKLAFRSKKIRPIKGEEPSMQLLFRHLTTEVVEETDENWKNFNRRLFEIDRSRRLHWVKVHIEEILNEKIEVFSTEERDNGKSVFRTYVYNLTQKYVVVLEPQRSKTDYYLLSAYHLNRSYGEIMMNKKMKNKLTELL